MKYTWEVAYGGDNMSFRGSILLTSSDNFRGTGKPADSNSFPFNISQCISNRYTQRLLFPGEFGIILLTEVRYQASFACCWTLGSSKTILHMVMFSKNVLGNFMEAVSYVVQAQSRVRASK